MAQKFPENIMRKLREAYDLEPGDKSKDKEIAGLSKSEAFDKILRYEGIIGYTTTIRSWVEGIYGVKLN